MTVKANIEWREQGRSKEYGRVHVTLPSSIEIAKAWDGRHAIPQAWIDQNEQGQTILHVEVKRDLPPRSRKCRSSR